ncbi:anthranilate synthase component I [Tumidithrix helvetica PCC 7403]|uniref:anthranilate synthase component I n=1 Tax=Tumidithrix helvetica TaxID=3457545 RepID=UPI003C8CA7F0
MENWLWEKRSLPQGVTGADLWEVLFGDEAIAVLLESPAQNLSPLSRYSIAAGKPRQMWTPPLGEILPFLQQLPIQPEDTGESGNLAVDPNLPFTGGYLGWLGYDFAWEIEKLPHNKHDSLPFPIAFWYEPANFAVIDHAKEIIWLATSDRQTLKAMGQTISDRLEAHKPLIFHPRGGTHPDREAFPKEIGNCPTSELDLKLNFSPNAEEYQAMVLKAKQHIHAGDIFQTNLSLRFGTEWFGDGWSLYRQLQQINPSPFASYWRTPWGEVISASPERLVKLSDRHVETRPIAGTRARGNTPAEDISLENELLACAKEQSEHIMLVDLERNDLGRVCTWGSVKVDELLAIERYSHVMHLVSNVTGELRRDRTLADLIKAVFPGGTITGCPKVRCMEIIEALETERRSLFYGSCGYIDRRGNLDLNILIRTLLKCGDRIWGQVGAGIVADSIPEREWHESLHKAEAQLKALAIR